MIDITKTYKTRSGLKVENLVYTPKNSSGDTVTFPIKGTIVKGRRKTYHIWKENGHSSIFGKSPLDLVEVNE